MFKTYVRLFFFYDLPVDASFNNDIALVQIKPKNGEGIQFGTYVQPICLPPLLTHVDPTRMPCFISGWGKTGQHGKNMNSN